MKVILTEQQAKGLINNLAQVNSLGDFDIEKEAPTLSKFIKTMGGASNIDTPASPNIDPKNTSPKFAPEVPDGKEPMHPLGHKAPISSQFGYRNISVGSTNHQGIDISTSSGSPVYAPLDGTVIASRDTTPNACGGFIQLSHLNMKTKFCHLSKMIVEPGQKVKKGQIIGYSGGGKNDPHPGVSTGPHLHYEILGRDDIAMNPTSYQHNLA
jgi:murein DD-endopeptidase MepM/ murein hydrolase activator NlpD